MKSKTKINKQNFKQLDGRYKSENKEVDSENGVTQKESPLKGWIL